MGLEKTVAEPKRLEDMPQTHRSRASCVDLLPKDIFDQIIEARVAGTHSVAMMIRWLHDESFEGKYLHVKKTTLDAWFQRNGYRA